MYNAIAEVCCYCGSQGFAWNENDKPIQGHGKYLPSRETYYLETEDFKWKNKRYEEPNTARSCTGRSTEEELDINNPGNSEESNLNSSSGRSVAHGEECLIRSDGRRELRDLVGDGSIPESLPASEHRMPNSDSGKAIMNKERMSKSVDKLVHNITMECFPHDYDAGTAEKQTMMRKVVGEHLVTFLQETLISGI